MGEDPHTRPETILTRQQMQGLLQATPSAGGQATGGSPIAIINVASQDQADEQAAKYRGLGYDVTINHVLQNLSRGEASSINRAMRTLQR